MSPSTVVVSRPRPAPFVALSAATAAVLVSVGALGARVAAIASAGTDGLRTVDQVVELGVLAAGAVVAGWLAVGLIAAVGCATARGVGRHWSAGERFVTRNAPAVVRRGLALSFGAGVGLAAAVLPAVAEPAAPPSDLGWTATQVVTAVPAHATAAAPAPAPAPVTVLAGDSLWQIAADHLAAGATDADIAGAWPRWYDANRAVVGNDPARIRPGQVLKAPAPAPTAGLAPTGGAS